jgi:hypothetical protein
VLTLLLIIVVLSSVATKSRILVTVPLGGFSLINVALTAQRRTDRNLEEFGPGPRHASAGPSI